MKLTEAIRLFKKSEKYTVEDDNDDYCWFMPNRKSKSTITLNGIDYAFDFNGGIIIDKEYETINLPLVKVNGITVRTVEFFIGDIETMRIKQ